MISVPKVSLKVRPNCTSPVELIHASTSAPTMTPQTLPIPPSTTIASRMMEMEKLKRSAKTPLTWVAKAAPPSPPEKAPTAYAASFVLRSGTPIMLAASSSSRMASHARPSRPSRSRSDSSTTNAAMPA